MRFPNFKSFKVEDVLKIERLNVDIQDSCVECEVQGRMDYQVALHDGSYGLLCGPCGKGLIAEKQREV